MDLLLISNHYVYIKDFDRFMFSKTKNKNKKCFCESCIQYFSSKSVLTEHEKFCLKINDEQAVKIEKQTMNLNITAKKYQFYIPVPFKVYADF